jgi:hopene-associated glycosyltransferase HpnB
VPLLTWVYLLAAHHRFWRVAQFVAAGTPSEKPVRVVAVIPARDEAPVIGDTVQSLLQQRFVGSVHLIVVDDGSADDTRHVAQEAARQLQATDRLTVIAGSALPLGWTGKVWAQAQGVSAAAALGPDFLLLTDADIHHDADNLASLVAIAQTHNCDLVSFMVELSTQTFPERCLIPAFVFFFLMLYPPAAIASPRSKTAGAAGGCMLIRPGALAAIGGMERIRSELIDDCALASAIKSTGAGVRLELTRTARSTRRYGTFGEIGRMVSRSAFYQLRHSWALLSGTILGLGVTYLLPPLLLLSGDVIAISLGAMAWLLMCIAYAPMVRFYRLPPWWSACLPAIALFYTGATLHSALQYLWRRGGQWKGRVQDVRV